MNKERLMSKLAFEASLCIPAALTWFVGVPTLFEERPLGEKVVRIGAIGGIWIVGGVLAWKAGREAYRQGYYVDAMIPDKSNPRTSLTAK